MKPMPLGREKSEENSNHGRTYELAKLSYGYVRRFGRGYLDRSAASFRGARLLLVIVLLSGLIQAVAAQATASSAKTSPSLAVTATTACTPVTAPGIPPPATVPAGIPGFHAAWYGQSGYQSLCPGQLASAVVAYYNSGSLGWVSGRMGEVAYLGTWNPEPGQDRPSLVGGDGTNGSPATGWPRYNRVAAQPADYVGPGQIAWFQFSIRAPAAAGTYRLSLRPLVEGATWMEDYGVFWVFTVLPASDLTLTPTPTPAPTRTPTPTLTPTPGAFSAIPAARLTTWNPGIPGGVPARTTVCGANVSAATYGNGTQDATAGIQAALDACPVGQVVQLSAGDFKITSPLLLTKGIVLRGMGPTQTKLRMPVGTNANLITVGRQYYKFTQSTPLAGDAAKGSPTLTLASVPADLAAGEIVVVDELTDPSITEWSTKSPPGDVSRTWFTRPNRPLGQVMEVQSVSGNAVTFTTPFHITFQAALSAQLSRFSDSDNGPVVPAVRNAGVEDLYLYGGSQGQGNIALSNAAYSWIKNIESDFQDGPSVALDASFRSILRDSYVHSTQNPTPGGGGYGISFSFYSADNLVENNIVWNMNKVMVMRASGGGNVIGYNYMDDGWIDYNTGWVEVGLNASHMTTPHYELFEGNESFNFDADNTWGNAVYITVFRNHLTGQRRSISPLALTDVQNRRAIGLMEGHWWYSFVGNVLGYSGMSPAPFSAFTYEQTTPAPPWIDDPTALWRLGYNPENFNLAADPKVLSTVIREGNFDYVTNQVHWTSAAQQLPASLYLTGKPAFFGTNLWPWVDPTGTTKVSTLPARARFDAMPGH